MKQTLTAKELIKLLLNLDSDTPVTFLYYHDELDKEVELYIYDILEDGNLIGDYNPYS